MSEEKPIDKSWMEKARRGFGPWRPVAVGSTQSLSSELKERENLLEAERRQEQSYIRTFLEHRDRLLGYLGRAQTFAAVDAAAQEFYKLFSLADDLLPKLLHTRAALELEISNAQTRFDGALTLALERTRRKEEAARKQQETREEIRRIEREANEFVRRTQEETARQRRLASDRQFQRAMDSIRGYSTCPRCGTAKPISHIYCGCCCEGRRCF